MIKGRNKKLKISTMLATKDTASAIALTLPLWINTKINKTTALLFSKPACQFTLFSNA
jgi:hypothetical protein